MTAQEKRAAMGAGLMASGGGLSAHSAAISILGRGGGGEVGGGTDPSGTSALATSPSSTVEVREGGPLREGERASSHFLSLLIN